MIANNQVGFTTDPERGPLDALLERPRQGLRRADRPRERRRPGGRDRGRPARAGLPAPLRPRRRHRPRRLPPLRPQRAGRAGVHAAADGRADRRHPDRARAVRGAAGRGGRASTPRRPTRSRRDVAGDAARGARAAQGDVRAGRRRRVARRAHARAVAGRTRSTRGAGGAARELNEQLLAVPDDFTVHPKLRSSSSAAAARSTSGGIDWGHAEALAFASLLAEASRPPHRPGHASAARSRIATSSSTTPRPARRTRRSSTCRSADASFEVLQLAALRVRVRSASSTATRSRAPEALVLWEAQFGDFVNGAQIDHRPVHRRRPLEVGADVRLTLLLPHGYEGNGPGALERAARAVPAARRAGQHPHRRTARPRRSTSTCCGGRRSTRRRGRSSS